MTGTPHTMHLTAKAKFHPGHVVVTPAFMKKVDQDYAFAALGRHLIGDWGILDREDWEANENALTSGARLLSVYPLPNEGANFWIITEAADDDGSRAVTTMLLPGDY